MWKSSNMFGVMMLRKVFMFGKLVVFVKVVN